MALWNEKPTPAPAGRKDPLTPTPAGGPVIVADVRRGAQRRTKRWRVEYRTGPRPGNAARAANRSSRPT